jgi:hypothetical protein
MPSDPTQGVAFVQQTADLDPQPQQQPPPKKGRTNTPWTPAEEQRLKQMRDAGNSWSEIAKVCGLEKCMLPAVRVGPVSGWCNVALVPGDLESCILACYGTSKAGIEYMYKTGGTVSDHGLLCGIRCPGTAETGSIGILRLAHDALHLSIVMFR